MSHKKPIAIDITIYKHLDKIPERIFVDAKKQAAEALQHLDINIVDYAISQKVIIKNILIRKKK